MSFKSENILSCLKQFGISLNENNWNLYSSNDLQSFLESSGIKGFYPFGLRKLNLDDFFSGRSSIELESMDNDIDDIVNSMNEIKYNDTFINSKNYFEQLVSFDGGLHKTRYIFSRKLKRFDAESGIDYELSRPSFQYIMFSFMKFFEEGANSVNELPSLIKETFFDDDEYFRAINEEERNKGFKERIKKNIEQFIKYNFQIKVHKLLIEIKVVESELESFLERIDALKLFKELGPEKTELLRLKCDAGLEKGVIDKFNRYEKYYRKLDHKDVDKRIEYSDRKKSMLNNRLKHLKNFENFICEGIFRNTWTIKVRSRNDLKSGDFENLSNTFLFYLNYNDMPVFKIYPRLFEDLKSENHSEFIFKNYKKELVYYYHRGLSTDDPTLSFLSFYHVLEFFCKKLGDSYSVEDVRKLVKDPKFSPNDEKSIIKLINKVQNAQKKLNDKRKLELVVDSYLNKDEIRDVLTSYSEDHLKHFMKPNKNNKTDFEVILNQYPLISKNLEFSMEQLVGRIYAIRNALVHSKEGEDYAFVPFSGDEEALKKEIPLIKFMAEKIILKTAEEYNFN